MSVREEERQKNSCPSRGLGIAAAAIGVGVGAALYYFFNKRQENPSTEGSSSDWTCERQQTFGSTESDDSYTTVSEHDTSDISMQTSEDSFRVFEEETAINTDHSDNSTSTKDDDEESSVSDTDSYLDAALAMSFEFVMSDSEDMSSQRSSDSESESREWDVTTSSSDIVESMDWLRFLHGGIVDTIRLNRNKTQDELNAVKRQEAFRERSWTLEECSICFDVMLRNQEVTSLPCTHNFHTECIMPWLQEKQTCPNCRKVAE